MQITWPSPARFFPGFFSRIFFPGSSKKPFPELPLETFSPHFFPIFLRTFSRKNPGKNSPQNCRKFFLAILPEKPYKNFPPILPPKFSPPFRPNFSHKIRPQNPFVTFSPIFSPKFLQKIPKNSTSRLFLILPRPFPRNISPFFMAPLPLHS